MINYSFINKIERENPYVAEITLSYSSLGFPGGSVVKNLPANEGNARGLSLIPGSGKSPGDMEAT